MSKSNQTLDLDKKSLNSSFMNSLALEMQDLPKTDIFTETSNNHNPTNLLSLTQLLGLSRLMNFIMYKSRQTNTNTELVENVHQFSFTDYVFAQSQLERKARRRRHYPTLQTFSHSNSLDASLTSITEHTFTDSDVHSNLNTFETYFTRQCRRRHCNSESGLFLPEANLSSISSQDNEIKNIEYNNDDKQCSSNNITTSIHSEETQNNPSAISNLNANNTENVNTTYESETNYPSSVNRQNESLITTIIETDDQSSLSPENQITTFTDELHNETLLTKITNAVEIDNEQSSSNDNLPVSVNNTLNKPLICSLTTNNSGKLQKSVSFADEVGKSLTEIFILCDDDIYDGFSEYDSYKCLNFGSTKEKDTHSRRSKFQIFYEDEHLDCEYIQKINIQHENDKIIKSTKQLDNIDNEWHYVWSLTFSQPASRYYEFRQKLEKNIVSLENISITQSTDQLISSYIKLSGTIKVKNICYEKLIYLRLTKDNWHTFNDYQATYSTQLSPNTWSTPRRYDTFHFNITIHSNNQYFDINEKIEFAICFTAIYNNQRIEYWDNNDHKNYIIEQRKLRSLCINMNLDSILNSPSSNKSISSNNDIMTIDKSLNINHDNCTTEYNITSYTLDCRPNFDGFTSFTHYRAWNHFSGETNYY
ncbi:hypothetical protein MN116_004971 [Schistosoma mekongi]|uniref:CBM21 domain-containing protein n=1 Tax=Schistosoma mekongi TaxID=38744 RepID=A0AAE1ZDP8_SCHME|nr:hypothetical protein MN116_004971 [Schistosoma mekongi]